MPIFAGMDVGGEKKGFHCVAIDDDRILDPVRFKAAQDAADWCRDIEAQIIGIDAPCGWSSGECGRRAEKDMWNVARLHSFSTPSEAKSDGNFYKWMQNGAKLYRSLRPRFPLYTGEVTQGRFCFETYPHAIAWSLAGRLLSAREKRSNRPPLLEAAGLELPSGANIDVTDAALCALTARYVWLRQFRSFGDACEGYLLVPDPPKHE
jgi:predicted RNase H-like nuclease